MRQRLLAFLILFGPISLPAADAVVLLHGLTRSSRSMNQMESALEAEGYRVYSLDYPSTDKTVEELVEEHLVPALEKVREQDPDRIHFVTHSLGGIMLRQYFQKHTLPRLGRMVMLGPPNQGSEVVDKLGHMTLFQWINGPAGSQLGTGTNALPQTLPVPPGDIGVIAGTRSINWILSTYIPGTDDGKVSTNSAKIAGMKDFATVPTSHPFLMKDPEIIRMTIHFLEHGQFPDE